MTLSHKPTLSPSTALQDSSLDSTAQPVTRDVLENFFSYLVHDLMSPMSSLLTGLDLLTVSPDQDEILDLLKSSVGTLRGRLELFRAALGVGGSAISLAQVTKILAFLSNDPTHDALVFETDTHPLPSGVGRHVLLIALWVASQKRTSKGCVTIRYAHERLEITTKDGVMGEEAFFQTLCYQDGALDPKKSVALWVAQGLSVPA